MSMKEETSRAGGVCNDRGKEVRSQLLEGQWIAIIPLLNMFPLTY